MQPEILVHILFMIVGSTIALAIPIFVLVLAWRAVKALEASARAQHDAVVALRSIANSQSKENQ